LKSDPAASSSPFSAGPLVVSFANNTNHLIASTFAGRLQVLESACRDLGGEPEADAASTDLFMKFQASPALRPFMIAKDAPFLHFANANCKLPTL
jgi:hypothetical protein